MPFSKACFQDMASDFLTDCFVDFSLPLTMTLNGTSETKTGIAITNKFKLNTKPFLENTEYLIFTTQNIWTIDPAASGVELTFKGHMLQVLEVDKDAAGAAYIIKAITKGFKSISIISASDTSDGQGGITQTWSVYATDNARIVPMNASETEYSGRQSTNQLIKFSLPYRSGVTESMKVRFNNEDLPIRSIVNVEERDQWLEITAERKLKA